MKIIVSGGRAGAQRAAREGHVAVVVDALRASATTASLLQFGVREITVVEGLEQAFAERERQPEAWLAGERGGLKVEGFDLGNSPLTEPLPGLTPTVVFSSSNMSRCCVGAATAPAVFLGTTVTCQACAAVAWEAARKLDCDLQLIPAGSVLDEQKLTLEDYLACGALIEALRGLGGGAVTLAEDATRVAVDCHAAALERGLTEAFLATDNGVSLQDMGFTADVVFASQMNRLTAVPCVSRVYDLPDGTPAAVLTRA